MSQEIENEDQPANPITTAATVHFEGLTKFEQAVFTGYASLMQDVSTDDGRDRNHERTVAIDDVLNTIDGVESKGTEVITILTSNDVKHINRAMLRPGRLDAIISVQAPDAKAAEKLIRIYARGKISAKEDLSAAGEELRGQIPATIREAVERSKLYAIGRSDGKEIKLTSDDIVAASKGMRMHMALLNGIKAPEPTPSERLGSALGDIVTSVLQNELDSTTPGLRIKKTEEVVEKIRERLM